RRPATPLDGESATRRTGRRPWPRPPQSPPPRDSPSSNPTLPSPFVWPTAPPASRGQLHESSPFFYNAGTFANSTSSNIHLSRRGKMADWPIGVFTSIDAGLGVRLDVAR